jgi:hypothetical protein
MPRFVILEHDHPCLHWDLMLETGNALRTWRLEQVAFVENEAIVATAIGDHRRAYLDYEGPVSGNRGRVVRWDAGTYELLASTPDSLRVRFSGQRLDGVALLTKAEESNWHFRLTGSHDTR